MLARFEDDLVLGATSRVCKQSLVLSTDRSGLEIRELAKYLLGPGISRRFKVFRGSVAKTAVSSELSLLTGSWVLRP
jgi:hypothetical protein